MLFAERKSFIAGVISTTCVSVAKCPVSRNWTFAFGRSFRNASAPAGMKKGSFLPQMASKAGFDLRKYSCNIGDCPRRQRIARLQNEASAPRTDTESRAHLDTLPQVDSSRPIRLYLHAGAIALRRERTRKRVAAKNRRASGGRLKTHHLSIVPIRVRIPPLQARCYAAAKAARTAMTRTFFLYGLGY